MKLIDTFRPVLYINGLFLIILSVGMIAPLVIDFAAGNADWQVFLVSAVATFLCGTLLATSQAGHIDEINLKQAFLLTTTSWLTLTLFGALPFLFSTLELSMADAYFESMSGLTTTGATVLVGLDKMPPGILLWRGILHLMGGIGIIVMAITILPFLRSGGMQLFRTESSAGADERVVPRVKRLTLGVMLIYGGLTIICGIALWLAGMTPFDATVHAMSTISTGGFSNYDASVGFFHSPLIENLITLFMISGALPCIVYLRTVHGQFSAILTDPQVRGLLAVLLAVTLILTVWLVATGQYAPSDAARLAAFNVTSIITTTGFASADYNLWGTLPLGVFMLITFVGGCTGSTSGGIKILRFQILKKAFNGYLQRLVYPHVVRPATIGSSRITPDVVMGVLIFIIVYCLTTGFITLLLTGLGLDLVTAFTGAAASIANAGPGLGKIIGPAGNYQPLSDSAKWVLSIAMLLGRLEFFTVFVLFTPTYWRS